MRMPAMMYGTAWKKERTHELVVQAVLAGFRGIDTACQPKHYTEPLVGDALVELASKHNIPRTELFVQTKFTPLSGQDPKRIPYDPKLPLHDQVLQSVSVSLQNLKTDYIDSLVLHSPLHTLDETLTVWRAMEEAHSRGTVRMLGISNCYDPSFFRRLHERAQIKPQVLQNRFYADSGYDIELREMCKEHGIAYQSFWTLTANPHLLGAKPFQAIAAKHRVSHEALMYKFVSQLGITPLNGTTNTAHMRQDIEAMAAPWSLAKDEMDTIAAILF